jgi:hypothetical protein
MSSASVRAHISQPRDILLHLPPQVVFDLHRVQVGCQVKDLSLGQFADFYGVMEVVTRHYFGASRCTDAKKCFERTLRRSLAS